jgi:hypothetical protein
MTVARSHSPSSKGKKGSEGKKGVKKRKGGREGGREVWRERARREKRTRKSESFCGMDELPISYMYYYI